LCNAPGSDNSGNGSRPFAALAPSLAVGGKVKSVDAFLDSEDKVLICTHATFRFAFDHFGGGAFDDRLIAMDESKFDTVTYTYYEQLNGYEYLKQLDIGYFFYSGSYADDILNVLDPVARRPSYTFPT
jgi:hypothetical protein